jgi:hypothetical protein
VIILVIAIVILKYFQSLKLHHSKRPICMKTDVIKKRNRYDQHNSRRKRERRNETNQGMKGTLSESPQSPHSLEPKFPHQIPRVTFQSTLPATSRIQPLSQERMLHWGKNQGIHQQLPNPLFPASFMDQYEDVGYPFHPTHVNEGLSFSQRPSTFYPLSFGDHNSNNLPPRTRTQMLFNVDPHFMPPAPR